MVSRKNMFKSSRYKIQDFLLVEDLNLYVKSRLADPEEAFCVKLMSSYLSYRLPAVLVQ